MVVARWKRPLLLLALALAAALLLGWAPAAVAGGFEDEGDVEDASDVAIDLSTKAFEVRACCASNVRGEGRGGGTHARRRVV